MRLGDLLLVGRWATQVPFLLVRFVVAKKVRFVVAKSVYVVKAKAKAVCSQTALRMRACLVGTSRPRAGHHQTAAVRGKGQGGRQQAGHSLSAGGCSVASGVSLDMSGRSGVFWRGGGGGGSRLLLPSMKEVL